ncbi:MULTISPECIES: hypothetical protein [unclassified Providencia]|uniref:hypothetical protein n=1 Tax=unclassified Providencia TaxID=2633465 RepID=UPI002349BC23|nr:MULTISPECIES: hypothetical protein [unclassified Providencia]
MATGDGLDSKNLLLPYHSLLALLFHAAIASLMPFSRSILISQFTHLSWLFTT